MTAEGDGPMGQAPMSFFAPNPALAVGSHPAAVSQELKHVIKELHAHGIEVILQVCMHEMTECNTATVNLQICSRSALMSFALAHTFLHHTFALTHS